VYRRKVAEKTERTRRLEEEEEKELDRERDKVNQQREELNNRRQQHQEEVQAWASLRNLNYRYNYYRISQNGIR
jgi:hypothetical protein